MNTVHRLHVSLHNEVFRFDDVIGGEIQDRYAERVDILVEERALLEELCLGRDLIDLVKPLEVGDNLDKRYGGYKNRLRGRFKDPAHDGRTFFGLVPLEERAGIYKVGHQLSLVSFFNNSLGKRNADTRQALLYLLQRDIQASHLL